MTRDYRTTVDFYREAFSWDTDVLSDTDGFRYTTLRSGDERLAGIMDATTFLPAGVPSHWIVFFGVADTDAALGPGRGTGRFGHGPRHRTRRTGGWPRWPTPPAAHFRVVSVD